MHDSKYFTETTSSTQALTDDSLIDVHTAPESNIDPDRANFLRQIEQLRTKFGELDALSGRIGSFASGLESATSVVEFRRCHSDFRDEIQRASQIIKTIKSQIDALEVSNTDFQARFSEGRESEMSFRRVTWAGFSNRLRRSLVRFNKAQCNFEAIYSRRTSDAGLNTDLSPSPDASPVAGMAKVFAQANAEEETIKREDMKRLERSLMEIREAFLQIAALVESQGEMLDCIEFSTVNAKSYAHKANVQLIQARKKQRRSLFWKALCIFLLVLIVVGIGIGIWRIIVTS